MAGLFKEIEWSNGNSTHPYGVKQRLESCPATYWMNLNELFYLSEPPFICL